MEKIQKIRSFLLKLVLVFSFFTFLEAEEVTSECNVMMNTLNSNIEESIKQAIEIPGLTKEEISLIREELLVTWKKLSEKGVYEVMGTDKNVRPIFVGLQAIIENQLTSELNKNIESIVGMIHTPMPATPLCTLGEISAELVDVSLENDPLRLYTIEARAKILRSYLFKGGALYIVYPESGMAKRTVEQQQVYKNELLNYPNNLLDCPISCEEIPPELIGATYCFRDSSDKPFIFAIKMTQAKDLQERGTFCLWYGPLVQPEIKDRLDVLFKFLKKQGFNL